MTEFNFYIDRKVTIWQRDRYTIEAETEEEAIEAMKEEFDEPEFDEEKGFYETATIYDSEEELTPSENGDCATKELYAGAGSIGNEDGELICDNAPEENVK